MPLMQFPSFHTGKQRASWEVLGSVRECRLRSCGCQTYIRIEHFASTLRPRRLHSILVAYSRQKIQKLWSDRFFRALQIRTDCIIFSHGVDAEKWMAVVPEMQGMPSCSALRRLAASSVMSTTVGNFGMGRPRIGGCVRGMCVLYHAAAFRIPDIPY
jgi:hypothetical protein